MTSQSSSPGSPARDGLDTAVVEGRLSCQRCTACGTLRWFPDPVCPTCLHAGAETCLVSGAGRLYSFTVVHRAPSDVFKPEVPYTIALVDLVEGPRVLARLDVSDTAALTDGLPVAFSGTGDSGLGPWIRFAPIS